MTTKINSGDRSLDEDVVRPESDRMPALAHERGDCEPAAGHFDH